MQRKNFAMDRRSLAKTAALGVAMVAIRPVSGKAADANTNVVFTEEDPGHWAAAAAHHVPVVKITGSALNINTPHPMSDEHFIVSHSVVLADGKFLSRKVFTPKDQPVSDHTLPAGYSGKVTVTSTCNLHDFWVKTITV